MPLDVIETLQRLVAIPSVNPMGLDRVGLAYLEQAFEKAAEHYERFLALKPDAKEAAAAKERLEVCRAKMEQ